MPDRSSDKSELIVRSLLARIPFHNFDAESLHFNTMYNSTSQEVTCMTDETTGTVALSLRVVRNHVYITAI